jgi:hypothetical protein
MRANICILFIGALLAVVHAQSAIAGEQLATISQESGEANERNLLRYVVPILKSNHLIGRIYYRAKCQPDDNYPIPFPAMRLQAPTRSNSVIKEVQSMFLDSRAVSVTQEHANAIGIRIGNPQVSVLRTDISVLALNPTQQFDIDSAISTVELAPEVQATMNRLRLRMPSRISNQLVQEPIAGLPHLPPVMKNITADQALNLVAATFDGVVVYGFCSPPSTFDVTFVGNL